MRLSIIIVNWNTGDLLSECLQSIYADMQAEPVEVWVVDNASSDDSAVSAERLYPLVKVIHSQTNLGFAAANNLAARQAQGEFIMLLNPDTRIHTGALPTLMGFLEAQPAAGAAGPRLINPDGTLQYSCSPEPTLSREMRRLYHLRGVRPDGYYEMEGWDHVTPRQVDVIMGACMLIRQSALEAIDFMDERFFIYSEEVDLCHRLRQSGWEIYWVPQAQVTHYGGQSTRLVAPEMFLQLYRAKVQYFRKHHGAAAAGLYKLILFSAGLARIITAPAAWLKPAAQPNERTDLIGNYQRLLRALPGM